MARLSRYIVPIAFAISVYLIIYDTVNFLIFSLVICISSLVMFIKKNRKNKEIIKTDYRGIGLVDYVTLFCDKCIDNFDNFEILCTNCRSKINKSIKVAEYVN